MDLDEIGPVQQMYVDAALRARERLDSRVRVDGADSLLSAAVSVALLQQRTDKYGGSFENRARFWVETIEKSTQGGPQGHGGGSVALRSIRCWAKTASKSKTTE